MADISKAKNYYILLNTPITSKSMSGGDKIYIKISEILKDYYGYNVTFIGCPDGINLVKNSSSLDFNYIYLNNYSGEGKNIILVYFLRLLSSINVLFLKIEKKSVVISASDFVTDTIPMFLLKMKYQKEIQIISSMFLRKELNNFTFKDILFYFSQSITIFLTRVSKSKIFTNLIDIDFLNKMGIPKKNILILPGGVEELGLENSNKVYDACFVGRISYQKGIDLLLNIWKEVVKKNPKLRLSLIVSGTDSEISDLKSEISAKGLSKNIDFFGFLDNLDKYQIMSNSKILLFPSRYESFGIVVAESLNLKVPVIAFELEALKLNYSGGIVYSKDLVEFTDNILDLINNPLRLELLGNEGKKAVVNYSWKKITQKFLEDLV